MSDDFCLIHGYEHMRREFGNPIPYCEACSPEPAASAEKIAGEVCPICHIDLGLYRAASPPAPAALVGEVERDHWQFFNWPEIVREARLRFERENPREEPFEYWTAWCAHANVAAALSSARAEAVKETVERCEQAIRAIGKFSPSHKTRGFGILNRGRNSGLDMAREAVRALADKEPRP